MVSFQILTLQTSGQPKLLLGSLIALSVAFLLFIIGKLVKDQIERRRLLKEAEEARLLELMRNAAIIDDVGTIELEESPEARARREMLENAQRLARENPQMVAEALKSWMLEESPNN